MDLASVRIGILSFVSSSDPRPFDSSSNVRSTLCVRSLESTSPAGCTDLPTFGRAAPSLFTSDQRYLNSTSRPVVGPGDRRDP